MDDRLREQKNRGTPLYPLQLYRMESSRTGVFIPFHWHPEIELIFIQRGTLQLTVNEQSFSGAVGDIFWIGQESLHQMGSGGSVQYGALVFPMEFLKFEEFDYVQHHYLNPICRKEKHFPTKIPRGCPHYEQVWAELMEIDSLDRERGAAYQFLLKASLLKLISMLTADGLLQSADGRNDSLSESRLEGLKAILSFIGSRYGEKLSLADTAEAFGLSPKYFSRYFKKNFKCSFVDYLTGFRLERAVDLLMSTDLSVSEIALAVGFDNLSYFIKRFRDMHGCTPLQFRKLGGLPANYHQLYPDAPEF
jgi:AraC-like DNA-binding protein